MGETCAFDRRIGVVSGQWSVVSGQWSVVSGQWSVVSGLRRLRYCAADDCRLVAKITIFFCMDNKKEILLFVDNAYYWCIVCI